jgi:Flp pilus assembly protein TadG
MPSDISNPPSLNRRRLLAVLRQRQGVSSLEWALVAAAFMLLIISIFDLVRYVVIMQSVATVMTEAGRACLVNSANCPSSGDGNTWSQLSTLAPTLDPSQFTVTIVSGAQNAALLPTNPNPGAQPGVNVVQVTTSYPFTALAPWMSGLNATITETATYFN